MFNKEVYRLMLDKCYRMKLIKDEEVIRSTLEVDFTETEIDNHIAQLLVPSINKLLNKNIYDLYQVLEFIDVHEEYIKEKIMNLDNASMIEPIIAFAIIDRLKARYKNYALLQNSSQSS